MAQSEDQDNTNRLLTVSSPAPAPAPDPGPTSYPPLSPEVEALLDESWREYEAAYRYLGSH